MPNNGSRRYQTNRTPLPALLDVMFENSPFERCRDRPVDDPFQFPGSGGQSGAGGLRRAINDEACAQKCLEGRANRTIRVKVMRPIEAAAQGEDRILHRKGFVGAEAEFAAGTRDIPGTIGQRKGIRPR